MVLTGDSLKKGNALQLAAASFFSERIRQCGAIYPAFTKREKADRMNRQVTILSHAMDPCPR